MPRGIFCQCPETDGIINYYSTTLTARSSQTEPEALRILKKQQYRSVAGDVLLQNVLSRASPDRCFLCSHCPLKLLSLIWTTMVPYYQMTWHQIEPVKAHQLSRVLSSAVLCSERYCVFLLPVFPRILLMSILEAWFSLAFVLRKKNIMTSGQKKQKGQFVKVTHQKKYWWVMFCREVDLSLIPERLFW